MTAVEGATALVTGGNRGIGRAIGLELLARGATKVYAGARDPRTVADAGLVGVRLDVSDPADVAAAAEIAGDVSILVNNAGILLRGPSLTSPLADARTMIETNVLGALAVTQAFAPVLAANGGGAVVDMHSSRTWTTSTSSAVYSATKAALWSLSNAWRAELAGQGTQVLGVHVGMVDTTAMTGVPGDKVDPAVLASLIVDALVAGDSELLADEPARLAKAAVAGPPDGLLQ